MRIGDQEFNRLKVLKAIRRAEPIARTDLAKLTGLAGATITDVTADLVRRQVIVEQKATAQSKGRPRVQLRLNPHGAHLVGAFMSVTGGLTVEIINLRGDSVFARTTALSPTSTLDALAVQIASVIEETIKASPFSKRDLHRVGVTLYALLDSSGGVAYLMGAYPKQPTPVAAIIEKHLQLPVVIDNSANVMARAEHWFGTDMHLDDFSLINMDLGMGSARYVEGMLAAGAHGFNPEMSHVKMAFEHGRECYCGATGCLATYCTIWGIVAQICEHRGRKPPSLLDMTHVFREFVGDARNGDVHAQKIFEQAGRILGVAVANQLNACDPGRVIILVADPLLSEVLATPFYSALENNTLSPIYERTAVEFKPISDEHLWKGSAALVLEQIYRLPQAPESPGESETTVA